MSPFFLKLVKSMSISRYMNWFYWWFTYGEYTRVMEKYMCWSTFIYQCMYVCSWRECGTTPELDHVRNGWWASRRSRWTSWFYGTMVLRGDLAHSPPSNIPASCAGQGKGTRNIPWYPYTIPRESSKYEFTDEEVCDHICWSLDAFLRVDPRFTSWTACFWSA